MTTWYCVKGWGFRATPSISPVEVVRETEHFVTLAGTHGARLAKRGDSSSYFPTWEEAKEFLVSRLTQRVVTAEEALGDYRRFLEIAKELSRPE